DARLELSGELDLASSNSLVEAVTRLSESGARTILLDIGPLVFIDSTGLRALLSSRAVCAEKDVTLTLAPAPEKVTAQVRRVLEGRGRLARLPFGTEAGNPRRRAREGPPPPAGPLPLHPARMGGGCSCGPAAPPLPRVEALIPTLLRSIREIHICPRAGPHLA